MPTTRRAHDLINNPHPQMRESGVESEKCGRIENDQLPIWGRLEKSHNKIFPIGLRTWGAKCASSSSTYGLQILSNARNRLEISCTTNRQSICCCPSDSHQQRMEKMKLYQSKSPNAKTVLSPTETVLSHKISGNSTASSFRDSSRKPLRQRPPVFKSIQSIYINCFQPWGIKIILYFTSVLRVPKLGVAGRSTRAHDKDPRISWDKN